MQVKSFIAGIILLLVCFNSKQVELKTAECVVYNGKYHNEYIYSGILFGLSRRYVFTWSPLLAFRSTKNHEFRDDDRKGVWIFEPAEGENIFFIKNSEYNEYFYATGFHNSFLYARRRVFTWMSSSELDDQFMWKLKKFSLTHTKFGISSIMNRYTQHLIYSDMIV